MYKYTIARTLATKRVITNRGEDLGKLADMLINERTGEIEKLIVEVDRRARIAKKLKNKTTLEIPYSAVVAVSDYLIIDERELGI